MSGGPDPLVIDPGTLRHKIRIEKAPGGAGNRDSAGQLVATWDPVLATFASIEGTNSRTFRSSFSNNALASQSTDAITIRWPGAAIEIRPGMRVVFGNDIFLIEAVDNVQRRNRKVVLACIGISEDSN